MHARPQSVPAAVSPSRPAPAPLHGEDGARAPRAAMDEGVMAWTCPPLSSSPGRVLAALGAVSFTWWVALAAFHSPAIAIAGSVAVLGAVAETLFPTHCRVTGNGVSARCAWQWRTLAWPSVKSVRHGADGVHLSPFASDSRLGRMRGVTLRYAGGNGPAVLAAVRRAMAARSEAEAAP